MNTEPPSDVDKCLVSLKGSSLELVEFGPGWVQLGLVGEYSAFLQVNGSLDIVSGTGTSRFDPSADHFQQGAAHLVSLRARIVQVVERRVEELELRMGDGLAIRIQMRQSEFEPVLFSGAHHMDPGTLLWHFVLPHDIHRTS